MLNRGIGGQTIDGMLERLDRDVIAARPPLTIWQTGSNETLRGLDPEYFSARLREGARRIAAAGGDLILMDTQIAPRIPVGPETDLYVSLMARVAETEHAMLFSRTALMKEWLAEAPPSAMIGPDGLHHTDLGYACVADALGRAIAAAMRK